MWVWSLGRESPLEEEMATHSSILSWRIPWTEEPDGLQSIGSQRVRHDWAPEHKQILQNKVFLCGNVTLQEGCKVVIQKQIFIEHLVHVRHVGNIRKQNRLIFLLSGLYTLVGEFMQMEVSKNIINKQITHTCMRAKSLQSCPTLCDPMDCSPPGSSVHGILQARILEWVAVPSFRKYSWPRNWTRISYVSYVGRWVLYHWHHLGTPKSQFLCFDLLFLFS